VLPILALRLIVAEALIWLGGDPDIFRAAEPLKGICKSTRPNPHGWRGGGIPAGQLTPFLVAGLSRQREAS
jgi:hypothetical protein